MEPPRDLVNQEWRWSLLNFIKTYNLVFKEINLDLPGHVPTVFLIQLIAGLARLHSSSHFHHPLPPILSVSYAPVYLPPNLVIRLFLFQLATFEAFLFCYIQQIDPLSFLSH